MIDVKPVRWFVLAVVGSWCVACAKAPERVTPVQQDAGGGGLHLSFATNPNPPHSGANKVHVSVTQADGKPLADADVTATFYMPAMPSMGMPEMRSSLPLKPAGDGTYRGEGELVMSGTWQVTVVVNRKGEKLAQGKFTVIAQ